MKKIIFVFIILTANILIAAAQTNQQLPAETQPNYYPQIDPLQNISQETAKISKAVQALNSAFKELLEKFTVGKGMQLSDRQQKLLLGYEVLNRAETRLEILQKFQIEMTQKDGEVKTRLSQLEESLMPGGVERDTAFIGTMQGDEMRENRRRTLEIERRNLQTLSAQINRSLQQNSSELRQAENFVQTLRRRILPAIEAEVSDL